MRHAVVLFVLCLLAGCGGSDSAQGDGATPSLSSTARSPSSDGSDDANSAEPSSATAGPSEAPADGQRVTTGPSDYGTMLFDQRDQAIYLFDKEESSRPECYGACAEAWPPVLTDGEPQASGRARPGLLGTVERRDGTTQVTYAGHPLYFYAHEGPGQVLCHDVEEYGGVWLVVTPSGMPAA